MATGMLGLGIGFAYWWTYFDFVGRRLPRHDGPNLTRWMTAHLPVTLTIAAAGAAMVSLIEHASEDRTPAATAWLLGGAVALGIVALVVTITTLRDYERLPLLYQPMIAAMALAAVVALLVGWAAPAPWLLALILVLTLVGVWFFAIDRWLRLDDPEQALPGAG